MSASRWLVRPPNLDDVAPLRAIATAVSQPTQPIQALYTQDANGRFWTITQQNQPIGYATLLPLPGLPHLFELTGGIAPQFQRQGAGSFLWQAVQGDVIGTAVQQITHTVNNLDTLAAHFLRHHQFELAHEEWTMQLDNLPSRTLPPLTPLGTLKQLGRGTAVHTLPKLYDRCFAHTPWYQPYTPNEITTSWEPPDELWVLQADNQAIGFAWLHFPGPKTAVIEPIGIVREKQGMGYGRFLLITILQTLQQRGIQTVSLGVWANNETAVHLYQSVGFQRSGSSYSLTYTFPSAAI
ncbi:GNAT family N-acetyltransferase [Candidatus Leptofilum sp.]|uniref:GNAT family N-acetyltransferase n=1 Tax=Candidatus Leptofilum sp. TaxID=3241576 RepID=UPI003B5C981C